MGDGIRGQKFKPRRNLNIQNMGRVTKTIQVETKQYFLFIFYFIFLGGGYAFCARCLKNKVFEFKNKIV